MSAIFAAGETTAWTMAFVVTTFMLYLYIGWRNRVRETEGFYVAGHGVPAIANGAATAADWMSAASFLSMAGLIAFRGSDGSVYLMGWTGGYVLLALLLAPYLRKFGKYTVPDFVGSRYYSETARIVAAICAIFVSMTYVAGQMRGVGIVFSRFLGVEIWMGVIVGMGIVAVFAVLGGMKGITWTQVVQYFVLILAFLVPAVAISQKLTGNPIPQIAFVLSQITEDLNREMASLGSAPYTAPFQAFGSADASPFTKGLNVFCITAALMFGTAGLPHVIVRFYTVRSVRAARWSAFWALLFIAILYTTAPALALFARYNLIKTLHQSTVAQIDVITLTPKAAKNSEKEVVNSVRFTGEGALPSEAAYVQVKEALQGAQNEAALAKKEGRDPEFSVRVRYHLQDPSGEPIPWATNWQNTGLLAFNDANADGVIVMNMKNSAGEPIKSEDIEVIIDKDIVVLATPEVANLWPVVIALVAAGGLAAALSTAAGLLLVISSSMAHDLYIHFFDKEAPEPRRLLVGRICILMAICVAGYFGINPPGFVGEIVAFAFGLAAASFFPAILLGIFDKRTNREGAIAGMTVGLLFTSLYIVGNQWDKMFDVVRPEGYIAPWYMTPWIFGIGSQGIGTIGMLLNFVITMLVSRFTPPPPESVQQLVERVRIPLGSHEPEAHFDETDAEADNP